MRIPRRPEPTLRRPLALLQAALLVSAALLPVVGSHEGPHHLQSEAGGGHRHVAWTPDHRPHEAAQLERVEAHGAEDCAACNVRTPRTTSAETRRPPHPVPPSSDGPRLADAIAGAFGPPVALHPRAPPRI